MKPLWLELLQMLPGVVTAVIAGCGVYVAWQGLDKWRAEVIGKRRAELAEDVLTLFYEARDIISGARSPISYGNEGTTRQKWPGETEQETRSLNAYYAVAERLQNKSEFFAKLSAVRYRFIAHFGKDAAKPFDEVRGTYNEIIIAVRMLCRTYQPGFDRELAKAKKWEGKIWEGVDDKDQIAKKLNDAVESIENICRPIIQQSVKSTK